MGSGRLPTQAPPPRPAPRAVPDGITHDATYNHNIRDRTGGVLEVPFVLDWMGEELLRYHITVIKLWEIPAERVLETPYPPLWPLAGVIGEGTVEAVLQAVEQIAATSLPREERSELAALLALLAGIRQPRGTISEALGRNAVLNELVRESSVIADWLDEGRAEGRVEGLRAAVHVTMAGRFGSVTEQLQAAIANASEAALEAALAHIAGDTQEELLSRLKRVAEPDS